MTNNILVTGGAGFIGSHLVDSLLRQNNRVVVIDNFNDFYDPSVKRANVQNHISSPLYTLLEGDIRDERSVARAFAEGPFDTVVHLAAMAGVRPSLENPALYMDVNIKGTQHILDAIKTSSSKTKLVFGSSSSVYGNRSGENFREDDRVDQPLSPYAASKAANELQCYAAHHTTGLDAVALRFFTVFGPRQRPDLAIHKFAHKIIAGDTIEVYGDGSSKRDYTFVSDIVSGIERAMHYSGSGFEIFNLGRSEPIVLKDMIATIEKALGKQANVVHKPFQTGDMPYTFADISKAQKLLGYQPSVTFEDGIALFAKWFLQQHQAAAL